MQSETGVITLEGVDYDLDNQPGNEVDPFAENIQKNAKAAKEEEEEPKIIERTKERAKIIRKIAAYKKAFPDVTSEFDTQNCDYIDDEALNEYFANIKYVVGRRNSGAFIKKKINGVVMGADMLCTMVYPDASGFYNDTVSDPDYEDIITELSIEYDSYEAYPPEIRLMLLIGSKMSMRVLINKNKADIKPVDQETAAKYANL